MNKNFFFSAILVMVLVFGITIVGCDNGTTSGDNDTWSNVTSLSQVNGSWKAPSTNTGNIQGMTVTTNFSNYVITFNATAKTMSASGTYTTTLSGGNVNTLWPDMREVLEIMNQQEGVTVRINNANHSYTMTANNYSEPLTDEMLTEMFLINQNGTKLKVMLDGIEIIYTKQ